MKRFRTVWTVLLLILIVSGVVVSVIYTKNDRRKRAFSSTFKTVAVSRGSVERAEMIATKAVPPKRTPQISAKEEESKMLDPPSVSDSLEEKPAGIKVMTFNIHHGVDLNGKEQLQSLIQEIKDSAAEIIALQEVDKHMPRSGFKDQAKEIAQSLGFYYVYGETINILGVKYGNALLSRYPILEYENMKLPSKSLETRGLLKAKLDVDGAGLNIFTTHLGLDSEERKMQIAVINEEIGTIEKDLILMGDFNGQPSNIEMAELAPDMADTAVVLGKEHLNTYAFYSEEPNTRIDRIYISKDLEVTDHTVTESSVSDHLMVMAVISKKSDGD